MTRRALLTVATILVTTVGLGCRDSTGSGDGFVVTGHIQNNTPNPLPANTRLLAVWGVSAGTPDYSYVFGEGTIDRLRGTFRIEFHQAPPLAALNRAALGVAFLVATTNQSWGDGDSLTSSTGVDEVIGITGQYAVIFVQNRDTLPPSTWVDAFDDGYSVGVGVKVPNAVFDSFQPTSRSSPLLIIDDLANIDVVNWT